MLIMSMILRNSTWHSMPCKNSEFLQDLIFIEVLKSDCIVSFIIGSDGKLFGSCLCVSF